MSKQFHGISSIILVGVSIAIAAVALFMTSWMLGAGYLVLSIAAGQLIIRAYCAKCPCKAHCAHVLPGKVAMNISRTPGPYTPAEMAILGISLLVLMGFPQYWLWQHTGFFIAFWALNAIAVIQIRKVVCKACNNIYCPLKEKAAMQ